MLSPAPIRAAPGRIDRVVYDPRTDAFEVTGGGETTGAELVVFYPAAKHGSPAAATSGLEELRRSPAPAGGVYLHAATTERARRLQVAGDA